MVDEEPEVGRTGADAPPVVSVVMLEVVAVVAVWLDVLVELVVV